MRLHVSDARSERVRVVAVGRDAPRTATPTGSLVPQVAARGNPGQKMMSPDLRRERSNAMASSRMTSASLSERRSFT
jgi:hypothetical protein